MCISSVPKRPYTEKDFILLVFILLSILITIAIYYVISCQIALFKISLAKMFQSLSFSVVIEKTNYGK